MTGKRTSRILAAGLVLLVAAGCGVRPSGVITGLAAPSGPAEAVSLYLLAGKNLKVVLRPTGRRLSPSETLTLLANGPDADEVAQGFTSEIPADAAPIEMASGPSGVTVTLSVDPARLSTMALDQIVCTAGRAPATDTRPPSPATTTVAGQGRSLEPQVCPLTR